MIDSIQYKMEKAYTTIPIGVIERAIVGRKLNHLKIYIYLKCISSGHLHINSESKKAWAKEIGITTKTLENCLQWLLKNRWLSLNSKRSSLRVVSYKQLKRKYKYKFQTGVIFDRENFNDFRAFCNGALIMFCINYKKFLDKEKRVPIANNGVISMSTRSYPKTYYGLPVRFLAKFYKVSTTTAYNMKTDAEKAGFIKVKNGETVYPTCPNGQPITREAIKYLYPEYDKSHIVITGKGVGIKTADLIKGNIHLKRKRC
jgi:hypothetical protein